MKTKNIIIILFVLSCVQISFAQAISKEKAAETGLLFFTERRTTGKTVSLSVEKSKLLKTTAWSVKSRDCMYVIELNKEVLALKEGR